MRASVGVACGNFKGQSIAQRAASILLANSGEMPNASETLAAR
jgi:hypothetical protein